MEIISIHRLLINGIMLNNRGDDTLTTDEILEYCLLKPGAYIDFPFGDIPICVKVEKKLFAQIYPKKQDLKVTLNCDKSTGEIYRNLYPDTVVKGYHCPKVQQPYFNTIYLNGFVLDEELKNMIDHSYLTVIRKLPRIKQNELLSSLNLEK